MNTLKSSFGPVPRPIVQVPCHVLIVDTSRTGQPVNNKLQAKMTDTTITRSATAHVRQILEAMINYDILLFMKLNVQCSISEQCILTECSVAGVTLSIDLYERSVIETNSPFYKVTALYRKKQ